MADPKPPAETAGSKEAAESRLIERFGRKFAAASTIYREGDAGEETYLLQEGRVRLVKKLRNVERNFMLLKPGEMFGESAILDSSPRTSTAIAVTDVLVLALDRSTVKALLAKHPTVSTRVIEQLVRRLRDADDRIELLMVRDAQSKVVSALVKLGTALSGPALVTISPVDLATRVGLDVDSVKRIVQKLRDQQYVRIVGERIEIPEIDALHRLYALLGTSDELRNGER